MAYIGINIELLLRGSCHVTTQMSIGRQITQWWISRSCERKHRRL